MSFEDGVTFLEDYMDNRFSELSLGNRVTWSTSPVKTYTDLLEKFNRTTENADWQALKAKQDGEAYDKFTFVRGKLVFIAGIARDMRTQFCCNITERQKTIMDTVRYELLRLSFVGGLIMTRLRSRLKTTKEE